MLNASKAGVTRSRRVTNCNSFVQEILYSIRSHHNYVDDDDDTFNNVVYKHFLLFLGWFVNSIVRENVVTFKINLGRRITLAALTKIHSLYGSRGQKWAIGHPHELFWLRGNESIQNHGNIEKRSNYFPKPSEEFFVWQPVWTSHIFLLLLSYWHRVEWRGCKQQISPSRIL